MSETKEEKPATDASKDDLSNDGTMKKANEALGKGADACQEVEDKADEVAAKPVEKFSTKVNNAFRKVFHF